MKRYLSVKQAAKICDVSEMTIRRWFKDGLPKHQRQRFGKVLIKPKDLKDFIEQR